MCGYAVPVWLQDDEENFCNSVRAEVKAAGILDSPENCWSFFIEKVLCLACQPPS